jgi:hypothetical protein
MIHLDKAFDIGWRFEVGTIVQGQPGMAAQSLVCLIAF